MNIFCCHFELMEKRTQLSDFLLVGHLCGEDIDEL